MARRKLNPRKLLVASTGVATISYLVMTPGCVKEPDHTTVANLMIVQGDAGTPDTEMPATGTPNMTSVVANLPAPPVPPMPTFTSVVANLPAPPVPPKPDMSSVVANLVAPPLPDPTSVVANLPAPPAPEPTTAGGANGVGGTGNAGSAGSNSGGAGGSARDAGANQALDAGAGVSDAQAPLDAAVEAAGGSR